MCSNSHRLLWGKGGFVVLPKGNSLCLEDVRGLSTQHKNEMEEFEIECLVTYCPRAGLFFGHQTKNSRRKNSRLKEKTQNSRKNSNFRHFRVEKLKWILEKNVSFAVHWNPSIVDFSSRLNCLLLRGFPLLRGFYVVNNPLVKPSLSINERFSTIEGLLCIKMVMSSFTQQIFS